VAASAAAAGSGPGAPDFRFLPTAIEWTTELPDGPVSPPVLSGEHVIVALQSGVVLARRVATGEDVWARQLAVTIPLAAGDGLVIAGVEGRVEALAVDGSGETRWTVPLAQVTAPPLVRGGWVILAVEGRLLALRAADGAEVWSQSIGAVERRPAIDGDALYVPVADGRLLALDLASGTERWARPVGADPTEPLVYGDRIYLGAGKALVCLARDDGREAWRFRVGAAIVGAPAADADRIYIASMDNLLRAFRRSSGAREWKQDLGRRPSAGPVLTGDTVSVPGRTAALRGFNKATRAPVAELKLPYPAVTPPALRPPVNGEPGILAAVVHDLGKPWMLVLASEAPPAPPPLPLVPLSDVPGTSLPLPGIAQ
jgi:outer membrane protein assembly factor BamB